MKALASASTVRNPARTSSLLAQALWRAAIAVLAVLPVGMAIAHRSSPAFVGLSAILALAAALAEGNIGAVVVRARAALSTPLGLAVLAFLAWCLLSMAWSPFKGLSLGAFAEFGLSLLAAFVLGLTLPGRMTRGAFWLLLGAVIISCVMMIVELKTGLALRRALGMRWNSFIFNRPVLTLLCLTPAVVAWLMSRVRFGWVIALGFAAAVFIAMAHSESGASILGFGAGLAAFLFALAAPRLGIRLAGVAFIVLAVAAPFLGQIADRVIPPSVHQELANDHSRDRVDIWLSFGEVIRQQPVLGAGFGVSPKMRDAAVADRIPSEDETLLGVGHPHNGMMQIWVELGGIGALLALAVILLLLRAIDGQTRLVAAASLALLAAATAVAMVGHGAWQGWWAASLGAAIVWMLAARRENLETKP
ncbi:O-antigen ligase family protein [Microvirga rosea]|uniref:O-antigen ligase family protein n=1 Tax=Microvirga rosea TaxID=2715425 RepID=UPI001D0B937C|nr:O-antigen ligase family protein [Microvirga rosea]MCB8819987.1 O-antigen ligase family protein [Microvirga rosea]